MIHVKILKQSDKTHFLDLSSSYTKYECYNLFLPDYLYLLLSTYNMNIWIKHSTSASRVPWWWLSVFNDGGDDDPLKLGPVDDPVHNVSKLLYGNIVPSLLLTIWPSLSAAPRTRDCQPLFNFLFWCKLLIDLRIFCCARLVGNRSTYVTNSMTWETWEGLREAFNKNP